MKNIYIDVHALQTVPPSCVNRDDTGTPKTAVYGGVQRSRISSQAWKHVIREKFMKDFSSEKMGYRTKRVVDLLASEIKHLDHGVQNPEALAKKALVNAKLMKSSNKKTDDSGDDSETADDNKTMVFISKKQISALAGLIIKADKKGEKEDTKGKNNKYIQALKDNPSIDIALFGRMVAAEPSLNYDAAVQVAHSISTHVASTEYDYFTAVDDCLSDEEAGAGHLGTLEFNSSTQYRYATINASVLFANLGNDGKETADAICEFIDAFITSMPTGKQNSYANRTLPDDVYVTVRYDQPVNLSGAYEKPVTTDQEGYLKGSEERLVEYAEKVYSMYASKPALSLCIGDGINKLGEEVNLKELLNKIRAVVVRAEEDK